MPRKQRADYGPVSYIGRILHTLSFIGAPRVGKMLTQFDSAVAGD